MGKIRLLKENVINQIAAGEVVERPLSIVKELIENSLDAYATSITIELEKGGKKRIAVKDNGHGMSEEDVFMSLERHATSKINEVEDLENVSTMGFRGEAIPSISAVTKFSISSAQEHGAGFKVSCANGKIVENKPVSIPRGTTVEANSLFFNVPARRKFLKSDDREFALVRELIQKFAVIHPEIGLTLIHNDRQIFTLVQGQELEQRILSIWKISSEDLTHQVVTKNALTADIWVPSPFASTPGTTVTAVNGRIIRDRLVNAAIYRTFREVIGGEFKSPVMLFLEVPSNFVDINVHPSKLEVRFNNVGAVSNLIQEALSSTLLMFREKPEVQYSSRPQTSVPGYSAERSPQKYSGNISTFQPSLPEMDEPEKRKEVEQDSFYSFQFRNYKVLGVLFGVYLVIEKDDTVIFLDQHASHERITFSSLQKNMSLKSGLSQMLVAPSIVKLGNKELLSVKENLELFNDSGFALEIFDEESVIIRAVPAVGYETDWNGIVKEMAGQLENYGYADKVQEEFLSHLATKACRASVKRNDPLTDPEIDALLKDINASKVLTCPHGRPFFFTMSKNDFEKKVHRQ